MHVDGRGGRQEFSDEGAKIWFSGYYKCQKSPKKLPAGVGTRALVAPGFQGHFSVHCDKSLPRLARKVLVQIPFPFTIAINSFLRVFNHARIYFRKLW